MRSMGGAGYGNPLHRDPERVVSDVQSGLVSEDSARTIYGVVLGENKIVSLEETANLRRQMASK